MGRGAGVFALLMRLIGLFQFRFCFPQQLGNDFLFNRIEFDRAYLFPGNWVELGYPFVRPCRTSNINKRDSQTNNQPQQPHFPRIAVHRSIHQESTRSFTVSPRHALLPVIKRRHEQHHAAPTRIPGPHAHHYPANNIPVLVR